MRSSPAASTLAAAWAALLASLLTTFVLLTAPAAAALPMSVVSDRLVCQCGCAAVLTECPHTDCGWGIPAKQYITQQLEAGGDPDALVQYYVAEYGEQVLAAPTKRGFNIAAWVTPFVALVIGAVAVYYLIGGWSRGREASVNGAEIPGAAPDVPVQLERRLEDELKDFD